MPRELRKRKAPASEPAPAPPAKKKGPVAKVVAKVKEAVSGSPKAPNKSNGSTSASTVAVGDIIILEGFGGEIETNDAVKTTLKALVDESKGGVVLFTYPKASTPGCTTQACLFRDQYADLGSTGFSIYGLSKDSPKANTTFKDKQKLPYSLLCDPNATLISAIGLKKAPSGTTRGVFVVDKFGKVLASAPGSPAGTVEVVKKLVGSNRISTATKEDTAQADIAAEVADTAEKLDSNKIKPVAV